MSERPDGPPLPDDDDVAVVADWVELSALALGREFPLGKLETACERSDILGKSVPQDVWAELQRRALIPGGTWPFEVDDDVLSPGTFAEFPTLYWFFAALGLREGIDGTGRTLFEECVAQLISGMTTGPGLRIGFPRRPPMPSGLNDTVKDYCSQSFEEDGLLRAFPPTDRDLGIDVVSWFPFSDRRGGFLHLVGQCATGADWKDKLTELNPFKWADHLSWSVPPGRFFATPVVVRREEIRRLSKDGGLMLDRPRLMELAKPGRVEPALIEEVRAYSWELYAM